MKSRVVVAMSGGVDSSAAAALLRDEGHEVIGVTLKLYDASGTDASVGGRCCTPRDIEDARRVAAQLGIAHYVLDERERFSATVVDDFIAEYAAGRTPNPCVKCNQHLKFGPLVRFARSVGADTLATGHYARVDRVDKHIRVRRAVDRDKDQSYFLFGVDEALFDFVRFPLGELPKSQVRELARKIDLATANKPDSQELCFIPGGDHMAFLAARGVGRAGEVVNETGEVMGTHEGTHRFTIGQRKGVPAVGGADKRFVLRIDPASGRVHVGPRDRLARDSLQVTDPHWFGSPPAEGTRREVHVQIRHHSVGHAATIERRGEAVHVAFKTAIESAAPGQAAVFYADDEEVLGGGWIADAPLH